MRLAGLSEPPAVHGRPEHWLLFIFFLFLVFLHIIFWEKPSYSGGFKLLFEGHCVHISKEVGFGNTPDWNAMISPLGSRRRDAWSEVLPQPPRLSEGPAVKTQNLIHNFLVFASFPPHSSRLPLPSHQRVAQALLAFQGYKSSTGADSLRWSSLVGCVFCVCFIPICSKESKPRTCRSRGFVLSRLTRFSRSQSQTWTPPVVVHVCSVYRNICIYQQLSALSCSLLNVQRSVVFY